MKLRMTMTLDLKGLKAYPEDNIPAARQNLFTLLNRMEQDVLVRCMNVMATKPKTKGDKLTRQALIAAYKEDVKVADRLLKSLRWEILP